MSEETTAYTARPPAQAPDSKLLPPRNGYRGMLPWTWLERTLRIEYTNAAGEARNTTGVLADFYPVGPVFVVGGAKTLISWECICLLELREDAP